MGLVLLPYVHFEIFTDVPNIVVVIDIVIDIDN